MGIKDKILYIYNNMAGTFKHMLLFGLVLFALSYTSCSTEKPDENVELSSDKDSGIVTNTELNAQNVFNSIPARADITTLISESKIEYNPDLLNNPNLASKYSLENSRALNLGVYGSDLSVSGAFDQTQESMLFLKCVNILAKNLGVSTAFDQRMMERMEAHKENRDSTLEIIIQSFKKADYYLKQNSRPGTSSLILSGAWVEGTYISCELARATKTQNIVKTILTQEESLKHLIIMLEGSNLGPDAMYILEDLKVLKQSFHNANAKNDNSFETIKDITDKTAALRKKIIETF